MRTGLVMAEELCKVSGMAVIALVLSIIAVVVAGVSAWYTRRQAVSADAVRKIESARRHDELQPVLAGHYVALSDVPEWDHPGVKLTNNGPLDLNSVHVSVILPHIADQAAIEGLYDRPAGTISPDRTVGMLRRGESLTFEVIAKQYVVDGGHKLDHGGTATFRCSCRAKGHEPWDTVISVEFPRTPWIY